METSSPATKPAQAPPPKKTSNDALLGKYELGRLLGRGNFAKVYYARSVSDGSGVAIKVLDKMDVVDGGLAPRVLREVLAMRRLSHPNIVRIHEVLATKSKIYLVMDHVPGGELMARVARRGRLPEPTARRYFQQLISALRFCHARGVSHRDVKPQNLLLDKDGTLKVCDFGLSALPDQIKNGLLHTNCGTPAYTAPEVFRDKGYDGSKADAWSCGVILYVLLAGFLPFDDANLPLMYRKIRSRGYKFPMWFPQTAKRIVQRLLDPDPNTRLSIEGVMELPWFKRSLSLDSQLSLLEAPTDWDCCGGGAEPIRRVSSMNAFDIISLSKGLDLSGLFEEGKKKEWRFTSKQSIDKVLEKIREAGAKQGYSFERKDEKVVGLGKWGAELKVEISELAPGLLLVELREEGGVTEAEQLGSWGNLKTELGDIVLAWHDMMDD